MSEQPLSRSDEIRQIHTEYANFYLILGGLALVAGGILIGAALFSGSAPAIDDITGYFTNLYTEAISVALTIFVLDVLNRRRDERNRIRDLQEQLVREAGSSVNATAWSAIHTLKKRGWLGRDFKALGGIRVKDSEALLQGVDLSYADLRAADIGKANLQRTDLRHAKLSEADLVEANLSHADLGYAEMAHADLLATNLNQANLSDANLTGARLAETTLYRGELLWTNLTAADLTEANLIEAILTEADFSQADLRGANLCGAYMYKVKLADVLIDQNTKFDRETWLPDETWWSPDRDLSDFGAETREVAETKIDHDAEENTLWIHIFTDGVTRRWQQGKGWLDDRDGNPIDD